MDNAIRLLKTQQMKGLPSEPGAAPNETAAQASVRCAVGNGVLYASAEITAESARRDCLQDSLLAEKAGFHLAQYSAFRSAEWAA
jgi:hypothetical protein